MIAPFSEKQVKEGVISYGLSSYGYDLRVADEFKIFTNVNSAVIDPKNFDERSFVTVQAQGFVTLEISNTTPLPAKVYANEGLCQILFFQSDEACEVSYADRRGKYQGQQGIVLPKL